MTDGFSAANNPAMSRQEIEELLDAVPVFAVTESDKGGIVLVSEEEKENEIAYFFFNPEIANSVFAPLRKQKLGASWDVTQFSLGMVWFELFQSQEQDEIEYRLVPDSKELAAARQLLDPEGEDPALFQAAYNSIPVFVDQSLRVEGPDGEKKFPMYFSLQDLMESCQQAFSSTGYQAAVNVADFCSLLEQMQEESENDFRNVVFVPPTTMSMSESPPPRTRIGSETKDDEPISTPTATDNWDD